MQAEPSDESLFEAYQAGDSAAFRAIFNRYATRLRGMLRRGLPSDIDADDLLQQVFLQLHRARADFDADRALRPWLWTVALNVKRQRLRRLKLERAYMRPLPEDAPIGTVPAHDPVRAENARRVRAALTRLSPTQREAIELHWLEGLSFPEVAEVVGASVSAVKVRAHRGYAALRAEFESAERSERNRGDTSGTSPSRTARSDRSRDEGASGS